MLTVSLRFPLNEQQHGCWLQQQMCVNQLGDRNIPPSHSWKYPLNISLTLTLLSTYIMRSVHSMIMHFICIFWGGGGRGASFKRLNLYWDGNQASARPHHFHSTVFPCLLCCGKNRREHQSGHLVYSSSPQRLVLFGVLLIFAECFICCLPQLECTYWIKYSPIVDWTVVYMHHSSNMLY